MARFGELTHKNVCGFQERLFFIFEKRVSCVRFLLIETTSSSRDSVECYVWKWRCMRKVSFAPGPCHLKIFENNISEFQKLLKINLDVGNGTSHKRVKYQFQIVRIMG